MNGLNELKSSCSLEGRAVVAQASSLHVALARPLGSRANRMRWLAFGRAQQAGSLRYEQSPIAARVKSCQPTPFVKRVASFIATCMIGFGLPQCRAAESPNQFWPQWRGPLASGLAPTGNPPIQWSETNNIRWKIPLPGKGHSSPIIWKDRIFVTAAAPFGEQREPVYSKAPGAHDNFPVSQKHRFIVMAIARENGKILWQKTAHETIPHEGGHYTGSLASNSPVTDGINVYACFGSHGLYCFDFNGKPIWQKDFGKMHSRHAHGEGSSPALHGNTIVVNWDHEEQSFLTALDKHTGKQIWKVAREETTSWSSPLIVEHKGQVQVIVSATGKVRGYDLNSGKVIWECGGLSRNVVASPVAANGIVYAANSYDWQAMLAIRLEGAQGDITDTKQVIWKLNRLTPYVPSPLLYDDSLYFLRHNQNVLTHLDAKTGESRGGSYRLSGLREIFASPVAAANRIYISDRSGYTLVFGHGANPQPLSMNHLDDSFSASAAIVDDEFYLRGEKHLYCIAEN